MHKYYFSPSHFCVTTLPSKANRPTVRQFPGFIFPQVVQSLVRRGGTSSHHLIAHSISNNSPKNYQNRLMCVEVIVWNISVVFWDTVCSYYDVCSATVTFLAYSSETRAFIMMMFAETETPALTRYHHYTEHGYASTLPPATSRRTSARISASMTSSRRHRRNNKQRNTSSSFYIHSPGVAVRWASATWELDLFVLLSK